MEKAYDCFTVRILLKVLIDCGFTFTPQLIADSLTGPIYKYTLTYFETPKETGLEYHNPQGFTFDTLVKNALRMEYIRKIIIASEDMAELFEYMKGKVSEIDFIIIFLNGKYFSDCFNNEHGYYNLGKE